MSYWRTLIVAAAAWGLARVLLGVEWAGVEVTPGVWRDGVGLQDWAIFWAALALLALAGARWLHGWGPRVLALAPALIWLAWMLWGSLGPIPWVIYGVPTLVAWVAGWAAGDAATRLMRPAQQPGI